MELKKGRSSYSPNLICPTFLDEAPEKQHHTNSSGASERCCFTQRAQRAQRRNQNGPFAETQGVGPPIFLTADIID
jgi:hypothetical protein